MWSGPGTWLLVCSLAVDAFKVKGRDTDREGLPLCSCKSMVGRSPGPQPRSAHNAGAPMTCGPSACLNSSVMEFIFALSNPRQRHFMCVFALRRYALLIQNGVIIPRLSGCLCSNVGPAPPQSMGLEESPE